MHITISGPPIAKKRHRSAIVPGRRLLSKAKMRTYDCQNLEKMRVQICMKKFSNSPTSAPLKLQIQFEMPIPESFSTKKINSLEHKNHTKKPDLDNLLKFYMDCGNGILWKDDSQIYSIDAFKVFSKNPQTVIRIHEETNVG